MAQSKLAGVRYTTNCFAVTASTGSELGKQILSYSRDDGPGHSQSEVSNLIIDPVIEIVTDVEAAYSGVVDGSSSERLRVAQDVTIKNTRQTFMVVHSELVLNMIKDVVKFYPSQIVTGKNIVIYEPYSVLIHHIGDFENLKAKLENSVIGLGEEADRSKLEHLNIILDFIRPKYQEQGIPAQMRGSREQPVVTFEDIWFILKPGSLAYTQWDHHWIGCSIEMVARIPPEAEGDPEKWKIDVCFLQMSSDLGELQCVFTDIEIEHFTGEKTITTLPVFPREFYDREDNSERRVQFEKRGDKIARIVLEGPKHMSYEGECLDNARHHYEGQVIIDGPQDISVVFPPHGWNFENWRSLNWIYVSTGLETQGELVDSSTGKKRHNALTKEHFFIISPYLSAFGLTSQSWISIHIENLQDLDIPKDIPEPLLEPEKLKVLKATVDSHLSHNQLIPSDITGYKGKGITILLHGPAGVGKISTVETMCLRVRRPLLLLTVENIKYSAENYDAQHEATKRWIALGERWGAIFCLVGGDKYDTSALFHGIHLMRECFKGIVFLITKRLDDLDRGNRSSVHLVLRFDDLDGTRRKTIWDRLQKKLEQEKNHKVRLHDNASNLLNHSEIHELKWHGHTIVQCFRTAVALAEFDAKRKSDYNDADEIVVDAEHFKDAINMTDSKPSEPDSDDDSSPLPPVRYPHNQQPRLVELRARKETPKANLWPITSDTDINLCIPELNHVEWEDFKAAANSELFRKTKFYAIDVLLKEPRIKFQVGKKPTRRREPTKANRTDQKASEHVKGETGNDTTDLLPGQAPLPERIRINSTTILKVFQEINEESALDPNSSILIFRPFRSLIYFEQEFRDWIVRQATILQAHAIREPKNDAFETPKLHNVDSGDEEEPMDIDREKAALENVRCLLTFIDTYIRPKQEYIQSSLCESITFADIWYLFNPGDTVIGRDSGQAYQVIEVRSTRHRVRKPNKETANFWRDDSTAEFEDNPVFVHCVHVDFNGTTIGPVNELISISHFVGMRTVWSLPIYPLRFASDPELGRKLIERGKLFVDVARVKHMHYSGLTLQAHDEVDSQVVIDFEEAFARNEFWKPTIKSVFGADMSEMINDVTYEPESDRIIRRVDEDGRYGEVPTGWCVEECCENEVTHDDEYVEARLRDEHIGSRMKSTTTLIPSVAIIPRTLKQITGEDSIGDDDYMIMSYRVCGFVLRNRKWAELDLEKITEVAVLGEDKGFDQLVLPPGHKDMVKSMIRQHFRDKSFMQDDRDQTDVVRGKGKGLIMLLHGVPGVGKTSTAECVADSFRRPLFQITSGDLGTTAKEVEEALETNFSLANRWKCILLIDEADVFLAERTKEDFVRNSLVAVFLRIMEYYAGVLFLTTNRVGVFDEAFTSRIHISLYYPPLERDPTHKIFEKNIERIKTRYEINSRKVEIRESEISKFALDYYDSNKQGRWNGRQIRNAFQSAIALAELEANDSNDLTSEPDQEQLVILRGKHFEVVAAAYKGFTDYLNQTMGADFARRARENLWRSDTFGTAKVPNALTTRLKVADPRPVAEPWPQSNNPNYGFNNGPQPQYAPPNYPTYHPYQASDPRYDQSLMPGQSRDPREGMQNPASWAAHPRSMPAPSERYTNGPPTDYRNPTHPGESST